VFGVRVCVNVSNYCFLSLNKALEFNVFVFLLSVSVLPRCRGEKKLMNNTSLLHLIFVLLSLLQSYYFINICKSYN